MTDSGLRTESQRSPSLVLRTHLEQGCWQRFALSEQKQLVTCRMPWPYPIDPFSLLDAPGKCWRFFWRDRESTVIKVGLGDVLSLKASDHPYLQRTGQESWFIALPFATGQDQGANWGQLQQGFVILPQVEWRLAGGKTEITVRLLQDSASDLTQDERDLSSVLRDILPLTLAKCSRELQMPSQVRDEPGFSSWQDMVNAAIAEIRQASLAKVVLSRSKVLDFARSIDLAPMMQRLSQMTETSYLFAVRGPDGNGFVGRSPERLLAWNSSNYYVDAIAGTRARSATLTDDFTEASELRSSLKDLSEHRFVSSYVAMILNQYCTHIENIEQESLLRLQNVQHIRSRFRGVRDLQKSPFALLRDLHPTPAVGGIPKEAANAFIAEHEKLNRGLFAGAFGCVMGEKEGDLAIGIRSALVHDNKLHLFAGAGIVEASDPKWEWQETEVKMKNFMDLFPQVQAKS
ncbi:MAG: isochorismate synthase [Oligoflexus sp.]